MFVHSGASLHGHEYSCQQHPPSHPASKRLHLLRTALWPLGDADSTPSSASPKAPKASSQRRPLERLPRSSSLPSALPPSLLPAGFERPLVGHIRAPITEGDASIVDSVRPVRQGRRPRDSTQFALAHPAPQQRTKQRALVQIRPRLLLQLQELGGKRPVPVVDVVPSSPVAGTILIPRLSKRFPRLFHAKPHLGPDDFLMLRSEDYDSEYTDDARGSEETPDVLEGRDVLAIISSLPRHGNNGADIVLRDGSAWIASPMANGSYEFSQLEPRGHAPKARWVKRAVAPSKISSKSVAADPLSQSTSLPSTDHKWTFSIIDPSSRRHPIMGVLTPNMLDIFDTHQSISASSGRPSSNRASSSNPKNTRNSISTSAAVGERRRTVEIAQEHKSLMMASAIWISLRQDDLSNAANTKLARAMSQCRSVRSTHHGRPNTFTGGHGVRPLKGSPRPASLHSADNAGESPTRRVTAHTEANGEAKPAGGAFGGTSKEKRGLAAGLGAVGDPESKMHGCRLGLRQLTGKLLRRSSRSRQGPTSQDT